MAVTDNSSEFEGWLCGKLAALEIDSEVYGSYITGILEEEDETENKNEALEGILGSLMEDATDLCNQVLVKWNSMNEQNGKETEVKQTSNIEDILAAHSAKVIDKTTVTVTDKVSSNSGDSAMKRALLDKYAEVYEDIDEEYEAEKKLSGKSSAAPVSMGLFQNVNAKTVTDAEKHKRDKQKEESQNKKDKDKLDREKQKLKKEDRKEKEKKRTQKKERTTR